MLGELTHRIRNILTVVQAIARHTLRADPANKELLDRFEGRLSALASAHKLLVESEWKGAGLAELAQQQLAAYVPQNTDRLQIAGQPVLLPADIATPFGLVLHELAVNAAKHGAFSNRTGKVALSWSVSPGASPRVLHFEWKENGGPAVKPAAPAGFGSALIESAIPNGQVKREFRGAGMVCTIDVPLSAPTDGGRIGGT